MLVDDDDVDVMGIERALKKLKILNPLVRAKDGLAALEILRRPGGIAHPYIILLDINMPRMSGIEVLAELRRDESLNKSVVFVLTTSCEDEDKAAAYAQHVAGYIVKEEAGDSLMRAITMLDCYWRVVELPTE